MTTNEQTPVTQPSTEQSQQRESWAVWDFKKRFTAEIVDALFTETDVLYDPRTKHLDALLRSSALYERTFSQFTKVYAAGRQRAGLPPLTESELQGIDLGFRAGISMGVLMADDWDCVAECDDNDDGQLREDYRARHPG